MSATTPAVSLRDLEHHDAFIDRHIGPNDAEIAQMLRVVGHASLDALTDAIVPASIKSAAPLALPQAMGEVEALAKIRALAQKNQVFRSFIGQGYYGTHTPNVILRNVLENPAWYTAYTPYQAEISQGRMEALINFQTMVADLTGMEIANASLLDEATACAEAMTLAKRSCKAKSNLFFVSRGVHPQSLEVIRTRAEPLGIELVVGEDSEAANVDAFGVLLQYPDTFGQVHDYRAVAEAVHARGGLVAVATDLLALALIAAPGEWGADIVVGNTQRFGVPFGFGGPHAAFMACRDAYKRSMPGRLIGVSIDAEGKPAYRLTLQTREQHIRREKATSNICTAQVLLAVMASMYAVYHGPEGLARIARRTHRYAAILAAALRGAGITVGTDFFDTLHVVGVDAAEIHHRAAHAHINLRAIDAGSLGISLDETTTRDDLVRLAGLFGAEIRDLDALDAATADALPAGLRRTSAYLTHPVFNTHHSEHELLRYLRSLADKDLAMDRTMIPLGSCTMKLNATAEMIPVTWPEFANIHPLAPAEQARGYRQLIDELEAMLVECTGYDAVSLQPNSGAQGEYAGLLAIRAYHRANGQPQRDICLIPESAHGTNPASAQMCGMTVVVTKCDANGNVDVADLRAKAEKYSERLAALMVTYPSTHGVFEEDIVEICEIVHRHGGQVYTDGANMNALVGVAQPGKWGSDVSHLNLHKTFCIPHGGGGPGVGPCAVKAHLAPYLPKALGADGSVGMVSAASFGSASILPISWMYVTMMGAAGLRRATQVALLNANYIATRLAPHYPTLYSGRNGLVAHECILDLRPLKDATGISAEDVAKRLIDFGFHAPTLSFPVAGTLMVEPTESESKHELDRFIDAMIQIREEIRAVEEGKLDREDNPLKHAPHTATMVSGSEWTHAYPRELAVFPLASLRQQKYWPPVARVDNVYGDKNVMCACIPVDAYKEGADAVAPPPRPPPRGRRGARLDAARCRAGRGTPRGSNAVRKRAGHRPGARSAATSDIAFRRHRRERLRRACPRPRRHRRPARESRHAAAEHAHPRPRAAAGAAAAPARHVALSRRTAFFPDARRASPLPRSAPAAIATFQGPPHAMPNRRRLTCLASSLRPAALLLSGLGAASALHAAVYTVGVPVGPGQCDYADVQAAVDAATAPGNMDSFPVIRLTRSLTYTAQSIHVSELGDLTIEGGYATCDQSVRDNQLTPVSGASGQGRVFRIVSNQQQVDFPANITLSRLAISGGDAGASGKGGGIYFQGQSAHLTIRDSTISGNSAGYGGGIYAEGVGAGISYVSLSNVTINSNTARHDGGGVVADQVTLTAHASLVAFNEALGEATTDGQTHGYGGGVWLRAGSRSGEATFMAGPNSLGSLYGNQAVYGGGVALDGVSSSTSTATRQVTLTLRSGAVVRGNFASAQGGGLFLRSVVGPYGPVDAVATLTGAALVENAAPEGAAVQFGGLGVERIDISSSNAGCAVGTACNRIEGNVAQNAAGQATAGALIRAEWGGTPTFAGRSVLVRGNHGGSLVRSTDDLGAVTFDNALIVDNTFSQTPLQLGGGSLVLQRTTLAGNTIGGSTLISAANTALRLDHAILWQPGLAMIAYSGGTRSVSHTLVSEATSLPAGATYADPRFIDPARGDYGLRAASPAVDASAVGVGNQDVLGRPRAIDLPVADRGGPADLGALERQTLQPLVLNGDFDTADLRLWTTLAGQWDGNQNAAGASGSGAWGYSASGLTQDRVVLGQQCIHLPGPGRYRLDGWGKGGGSTVTTRDYAVVEWEYRREGTEACSGGAATASGQVSLGGGTSWVRPAQPVELVDVFPQDWTASSSITLRLVGKDGGVTSPASISVWFDGIALLVDGSDRIFAHTFE